MWNFFFQLALDVHPELDPVAVEVLLWHGRAEDVPLEPVHDVGVRHVDEVRERLVEEVVEVGHGVDVLLQEAHAPQVTRGHRGQRGQSGHGLVEARVGGAPEMGFASFAI